MFCPECKAEYRERFKKCSDCNVDLVEQLPPEQAEEFVDYVEVLRTSNPSEIALIKSILDSEDIIYYLQGEHANFLIPSVLAARLRVNREQVEKTIEVLKDLNLPIKVIDPDKQAD